MTAPTKKPSSRRWRTRYACLGCYKRIHWWQRMVRQRDKGDGTTYWHKNCGVL